MQDEAAAAGGKAPAPAAGSRAPFESYADMRHAAPRPSPYEALESAGPPV